ncbi:MAG: hypothetical protein K8R59_09610 [Thermoanaerobaculales bacterium]|nr:hypothetical protein [Thermoanaerobaculales bacterium]
MTPLIGRRWVAAGRTRRPELKTVSFAGCGPRAKEIREDRTRHETFLRDGTDVGREAAVLADTGRSVHSSGGLVAWGFSLLIPHTDRTFMSRAPLEAINAVRIRRGGTSEFGVASINYQLKDLLTKAVAPEATL